MKYVDYDDDRDLEPHFLLTSPVKPVCLINLILPHSLVIINTT